MTSPAPEPSVPDLITTPGPEIAPPGQTHTTVGKSIGWLVVFFLLFYGVAMMYGVVLGVKVGFSEARLASENPAAFQEVAAVQIEETLLSPAGLFTVGLWQFVLLVPLVLWASHYKDRSWRESLAVKPVAGKVLGTWLLIYSGYFLVQTVLTMLFQPELGTIFDQIVGSKHTGVFLFIAVMAPVVEELVFRGYLFQAWRHTRLGATGTILITAGLFSLLHAGQYGGLILGYMFAFGILLGAAREKTNSVLTPVLLHITNNAIAGVAMIYLGLQ